MRPAIAVCVVASALVLAACEGPQGPQGATGPQGPAGPQGVPGTSGYLQVPGAASASNSTSPKTVTATCTGGRVVVGGGGVTNGATQVALTQSQPTSSTVWSVTATEISSTNTNWTVQAFAICMNAP